MKNKQNKNILSFIPNRLSDTLTKETTDLPVHLIMEL